MNKTILLGIIFIVLALLVTADTSVTKNEIKYNKSDFEGREIRAITIQDIQKIINLVDMSNNFVKIIKGEEYTLDGNVYRNDIIISKTTVFVRAYEEDIGIKKYKDIEKIWYCITDGETHNESECSPKNDQRRCYWDKTHYYYCRDEWDLK